MAEEIIYRPIGVIHSPLKTSKGAPIQPEGAKGIKGSVSLDKEYRQGIKDLGGFSHIILVYHFHLVKGYSLKVKPYMDNHLHGIFATRAPKRPNPIGISVVRLNKIKGSLLYIEDVDVIDGTPLLDIKPYVSDFDKPQAVRIGWLEKNVYKLGSQRDDGRFIDGGAL